MDTGEHFIVYAVNHIYNSDCRYDKAEKAKLQAKKKAALEKLENGEAVDGDIEGLDGDDDDKIDETEEAGKPLACLIPTNSRCCSSYQVWMYAYCTALFLQVLCLLHI